MATYVSLVNKAISESGCDLALYQADGSDFDTNTDPMLNRFKEWVVRSWTTIQQVAFDWQFLNNQGLVTINPGLMFYNEGDIAGAVGTTIDIYGTDAAVLFSDVPVGPVYDLTYTQYSDSLTKSFGYINLACSGDEPLVNLAFKAGGDYFQFEDRLPIVTITATSLPLFESAGMYVGDTLSFILLDSMSALIGVYNDAGELLTLSPDSGATRGSDGYSFSTLEQDVLDAIDANDFQIYAYNHTVSLPSGWVFSDGLPVGWGFNRDNDGSGTTVVTLSAANAYLHSWKSFDFSEEFASDDYAAELCEINHDSFKIIDHESPSASTVRPMAFMPWSIFTVQYDNLTNPPSTPVYITKDNTGRWRLFPHPNVPVTLKFDYNRIPQTLVLYDDVPKGLPSDFMELVMWLAVRMYGEYDEQPSVARRSERYYKDLLQRLQIKYRPKFRFQPKRLY